MTAEWSWWLKTSQWGTRTVEGTGTFVRRVYIVLELHLIKKKFSLILLTFELIIYLLILKLTLLSRPLQSVSAKTKLCLLMREFLLLETLWLMPYAIVVSSSHWKEFWSIKKWNHSGWVDSFHVAGDLKQSKTSIFWEKMLSSNVKA